MPSPILRILLIPLLVPFLLVCNGDSDPLGIENLGDGLKVLMIGNSLTWYNDLPGMVQTVGEAAGKDLSVRSVAKSNYALEDHWADGDALAAIESADWDVVVLQQGPSSLALNRIHLREWSERFDTVIRGIGARPALYMVWPEFSRLNAWDAVTLSYTGAAEAVDGLLFPVGEAWRMAWTRNAGLGLYGPDSFHPSKLGSALGALVIFQALFDESPIGLPAVMKPNTDGLPTIRLTQEEANILQEAAVEANERFGRR
jgi:hypothetical protein